MFEKDEAALAAMGAHITTREIKQQPDLWESTLKIYENNLPAIESFLARAQKMSGEKPVHVTLAGAGSSAYVSDTVTPYLRHVTDAGAYVFEPRPTTDVVSAPLDYLRPSDPTVFVSFARSGNSPESLAAVERADQVLDDVLFLNITCAPDGALARQFSGNERALTLLIPEANDLGFAMTGSYSCMELLCTLIFDPAPLERKAAWVAQASDMGRDVVAREDQIASWLDDDFDRITYLGSGTLAGMTRECQLKILELTAGKIATCFDSSMGYRHGPKSFVDSRSLVFGLVSNDPYTRDYDLDILNEVAGDGIASHVIAIQQPGAEMFVGESFTFDGEVMPLPEGYLALSYVMVAQTVALLTSVKVGNTPDTPSPTGTVNRVVKGVTIHPFVV